MSKVRIPDYKPFRNQKSKGDDDNEDYDVEDDFDSYYDEIEREKQETKIRKSNRKHIKTDEW
jgi:hypothetical protein